MPQTMIHRAHVRTTADGLGREFKEALPLQRIESLSIHDRKGDLVWLSEQALGPDEHHVVMEAITVFEVEGNRAYLSQEIGGGRSAAFFASSTPLGELVAVVMAIAETRSINSLGTAKAITPKVRTLLQRLAILMKPPKDAAGKKPADGMARPGPARKNALAISDAGSTTLSELEALGQLEVAETPATPPTKPTNSNVSEAVEAPEPRRGDAIRLPVVARLRQPAATDSVQRRTAIQAQPAADTASAVATLTLTGEISLHVQQLMKLRSGGRTRRYEVLVRGRHDSAAAGMSETLVKALSLRESAAAIDRAVVIELASWLKQHPQVWNSDPCSFSINLSLGSLLDPQFSAFIAQTLHSSGVAPDTIGFEVTEQAFLKHRDACSDFLDACEKIGCYVVIDDFSMHSDVVPFLASRALRVVKIDPQLTQSAMRERLSQAMVIAISQASKVLGLHCVAKRIDSVATRQWLAAVGIDFAQGFALENPQPLDALASAKAAQTPS